jgi:hypothetical protein
MVGERRPKILLAGLAILLAGCGVFIAWRIQRTGRALSEIQFARQNAPTVLQASPQNLIPPAPPLDERVVPTAPPAHTSSVHQLVTTTPTYEPALSYAANLKQLYYFCETDNDPRTLEKRVKDFVIQLLEHAKTNGSAIKDALQAKQGSPLYRNVLLACLMQADLDDKQGIAWSIALDQGESISVRRTAAFVLKELPVVRLQPNQLIRLLADPDDQVKVFALQSAVAHMNGDIYSAVQNLTSTSSDIHVRLAALCAIGQTPDAGKNAYLIDLIGQQQTSAADEFSEISLVKRAAIGALDASSSDAYATAWSVALDTNEDPGVRRHAILKCAQTPRSDTLEMLTNLLRDAKSEDALIIKACVEGLQLIGEPTGITAIHDKLAQTQDQEIRALISYLIHKQTKEE